MSMRCTGNPGGVGGWWIKKMFIDPSPAGEPFWARNEETGKVELKPIPFSVFDLDDITKKLGKRPSIKEVK